MNWRNRDNDGVYLSFFLTLLRLEIWHDSSKIFCLLGDMASDFTYHTCFFYLSVFFKRVNSVLSSPELHVDPILFYVILCTNRVTT